MKFIPFEKLDLSDLIKKAQSPNYEIRCICCQELKKQKDTGMLEINKSYSVGVCKDCAKDVKKIKSKYTSAVIRELRELNVKRYLR